MPKYNKAEIEHKAKKLAEQYMCGYGVRVALRILRLAVKQLREENKRRNGS